MHFHKVLLFLWQMGSLFPVEIDGVYLYFRNAFCMMPTRHAETNAPEVYC